MAAKMSLKPSDVIEMLMDKKVSQESIIFYLDSSYASWVRLEMNLFPQFTLTEGSGIVNVFFFFCTLGNREPTGPCRNYELEIV